jgi:tetratricopeptide (TPR) repeat protein
MKKLLLILMLLGTHQLFAQSQPLTTPNNGGNKKAAVSEYIGLCEVKIEYNRPGVKGREGKIWGTNLAFYGLTDQQFGSSKAAPWRVGANESTTISFSTDVMVDGKMLPAGKYGLFMNCGEKETIVIFNKNTTAWGSFSYDPAEDVLQVTVRNEVLDKSVEWMKFEFENQTENSAVIALMWEKRKVPFKVQVDLLKTQFASFKRELETPKGFSYTALVQAANFSLRNNYELAQGSIWASKAINPGFPGERNFITLSTKANFLIKENKNAEADVLMKEAVNYGTAQQLNGYANSLMAQKKADEAAAIYLLNYNKYPTVFVTNYSLAKMYSQTNQKEKALKFAKSALQLSNNEAQKTMTESLIKELGG